MEIDLALANEAPADAAVIRDVLDRLSVSPKDGAKTAIGQRSRLHEIIELREKHGHDAWLYAMRKAAAKKGLRDLGYVATIAAGYEPGDEMQGRGSARRLEIAEEEALLERGRAANAELHREDEEQNRQAREERERREARGA